MQEPPWMPRTEEEYRQQVAEDAGPHPDEMVRLQKDLDAADATAHEMRQQRDKALALLSAAYPWLHNPSRLSDGSSLDALMSAEFDALVRNIEVTIQRVPDGAEGNIGRVLYGPCDGFFGQHHYGAWVIETEGKDWIVARALDPMEAAGPCIAVFHPTHDRQALIEKWSSEESRRVWMED